jgi:hypothetical protein
MPSGIAGPGERTLPVGIHRVTEADQPEVACVWMTAGDREPATGLT